jgi:hypothetical protein
MDDDDSVHSDLSTLSMSSSVNSVGIIINQCKNEKGLYKSSLGQTLPIVKQSLYELDEMMSTGDLSMASKTSTTTSLHLRSKYRNNHINIELPHIPTTFRHNVPLLDASSIRKLSVSNDLSVNTSKYMGSDILSASQDRRRIITSEELASKLSEKDTSSWHMLQNTKTSVSSKGNMLRGSFQ